MNNKITGCNENVVKEMLGPVHHTNSHLNESIPLEQAHHTVVATEHNLVVLSDRNQEQDTGSDSTL
jgi:hypothetical protein